MSINEDAGRTKNLTEKRTRMRTAQNHNVLVESKVSTFEFVRNYVKSFKILFSYLSQKQTYFIQLFQSFHF